LNPLDARFRGHDELCPSLFPKGEKVEFSSVDTLKSLLPLKKGGREGFLGKPFQDAKTLRKILVAENASARRFLLFLIPQT